MSASLVSNSFFRILGVGAAVGRTFLPEEGGTPGAHPVVLVSGSDPGVVGKTILLNGIAEPQVTMVGRLKGGISRAQARAELSVLSRQLARLHPDKEQTNSTVGINVP